MKLGLIIWYAWLLIFAIADPAHGAAKADLKKRSGQVGDTVASDQRSGLCNNIFV